MLSMHESALSSFALPPFVHATKSIAAAQAAQFFVCGRNRIIFRFPAPL
jgi:hypothetical protein